MDRDDRHGPVSVQAGVELIEQVNLETPVHQLLLHQLCDAQVDLGLGEIDLAIGIRADRAGIIAGVSGHDPDAQRRLRRPGRIRARLGREHEGQPVGE